MNQTILLIDDDALLRRSLAYTLGRAGYEVCTAGTAVEGLELARQSPPDLVLLDIGLPGIDGLDALHTLRRDHHMPVILLTARRSDQDEALGLRLGADDYVKKPYDTDVLLARIDAVLRRAQPISPAASTRPLVVGKLEIDPRTHTVRTGQQVMDITPRAFDVLYLLARHAGDVVPLGTLLTEIWGRDYDGEPQVLYVHIRWLREKLQGLPECKVQIVTVHRVGYKLVVEEC